MDILVCATRSQKISTTWPSQLNSVLLNNGQKYSAYRNRNFKEAVGGSKHNTELCVPWMF